MSSTVGWTGKDEPRVGDHCVTTRRIGFADRPATSELIRFEPPHRWGVRGVDGPIRARVDVTVEPRSDTRALITIAVDFEGHGIGRLLVPLVVRREARREMGSRSVETDSKQTSACAYLSAVVLVGLVLNAWVGWWWADPIAALGVVVFLVREGRLAFSAEHIDDCC